MMELMNSLTGVSSSGQSRSPYLGGEHLIPYDFNYLLICLDLADAPISSPLFPEGELAVDDMMVDDDCE
jgi:hypothetical protein